MADWLVRVAGEINWGQRADHLVLLFPVASLSLAQSYSDRWGA